jgi:DNA repair exonuclease SbcCD ATPase subunit
VWVEELDVRGFKHLSGVKRFDQGLNLVLGPNESGKSTLHDAILRSTYGFTGSERRKRAGVSVLDRCAPWGEGEFAVNAIVHAGGGRYRVEWDFARHHVVLHDAATGEDRSEVVRAERDEVQLGEFLLGGLGPGEFRSICCLGQEDLATIDKSESLVLALQRAVEAGSAHPGVEQAVELLNAHLRESIGVRVDNLRANRGGPLAVAEQAVADLGQRLQSTSDAREELGELAQQLRAAEEERDRVDGELRRAEQQRLVNEEEALAQRLAAARDHREHSSRDALADDHVDRERVERADHLLASLSEIEARVEELRKEADRQAPVLAGKEDERRRAQADVDALAAYSEIDTAGEREVRELAAQLDGLADGEPEGPASRVVEPDPELERYRAQRPQLVALATDQSSSGIEPARVAVAAVLAVISVALGALVHPLGLAGLALAVAVLLLGRDSSEGRTGLEAALREYRAASLDELDERVAEEDRQLVAQQAVADERRSRTDQAERARAQLEQRLDAVLDGVHATPVEDIRGRAEAYLAACESRQTYEARRAVVADLDLELVSLRQPARDLAERQRERDDVQARLLRTLDGVGVHAETPEEAIRGLRGLNQRLEEAEQAAAASGRAHAALEGVLQGVTMEQLEERAARARGAREAHVATHGRLAEGPRPETEDLEVVLRERQQQAALRATELSTRIIDREADLEQPAVLTEQLERERERCHELERSRDAAALARDVLGDAAREVHRAFAPHLNAALEETLPRLTGGRYREAVVGEDLSIQVEAPETGRLEPASALSRGTQSQIYLVERLAMAELLDATTGGAPLLLDDPFARFDDARRRHGLELLAGLAASRQVILFSDDRRLLDELASLGSPLRVLELSGPPAVVVS